MPSVRVVFFLNGIFGCVRHTRSMEIMNEKLQWWPLNSNRFLGGISVILLGFQTCRVFCIVEVELIFFKIFVPIVQVSKKSWQVVVFNAPR